MPYKDAAKQKEYQKKYREANIDRVRVSKYNKNACQKYYKANREKIRAQRRERYKTNREKILEQQKRYREKKLLVNITPI